MEIMQGRPRPNSLQPSIESLDHKASSIPAGTPHILPSYPLVNRIDKCAHHGQYGRQRTCSGPRGTQIS
jgi:hypothetical protein